MVIRKGEALSRLGLLRTFLTVADHNSFSKAAQNLYTSQPAVSSQVKRLEQAVGMPLFEVSGRTIKLTQAGQLLYEYSEKMLGLADEFAFKMGTEGNTLSGPLEILSDGHWKYIMPPLLAKFFSEHSSVKITLRTHWIEAVLQTVLADGVRLGFVVYRPQDARLLVHSVGNISLRHVVIAAKNHAVASMNAVEPKTLEEHVCVTGAPPPAPFVSHFEPVLSKVGVSPSRLVEVGGYEDMMRVVARGVGIALVPDGIFGEEGISDNLAQVPFLAPPIDYTLFAVQKRNRRLSAVEQAFLEYVTENWRIGFEPGVREG